MNQEIIVYTDGGARGNGKEDCISAWAYTLRCGERYKEDAEAYIGKTNNQMELMAIIKALEAIRNRKLKTKVHSDSAYCINGITTWIHNWKKKGWINSKKEVVENKELWMQLDALVNEFEDIEFIKVKGHSDVLGNIRVDQLVNEAMDKLQ